MDLSSKSTFLVVYDGECAFCNRSVQLVSRFDKRMIYKLTPFRSELGDEICRLANISPDDPGSLIAIVSGNIYLKSTAVLQIASSFGGLWKIFRAFELIPIRLRGLAYDSVAKRRKTILGPSHSCLFDPKLNARIITEIQTVETAVSDPATQDINKFLK